MSVRTNAAGSKAATAQQTPAIDFKTDFLHSTAALAANHDETVTHILHRLDQLQSKISTQPEDVAAKPSSSSSTASIRPANRSGGDLHARLAALEDIHENALHRMGAKLEQVDRKLSDTREAEGLMGRIASKFTAIESQLKANKDSDELMTRIASKFSQVEDKLHSATQLSDRVARLESQLRSDPEHERLLTRINAKLDQLEAGGVVKKGTPAVMAKTNPATSMGAELGREERMGFLRDRISKLTELKAKYEMEERNMALLEG